jgi:aryl-alcohol dehydrogenase-like predicted oxidoreductase
VVSYSPLARGVLTAKYESLDHAEPGSRAARKDKRLLETEWRAESIEIAKKIRDYVAARDIDPVDFAVGWVLNNRLVTATLAGPRTLAQWEGYVKALEYRFTPEDEALVDSLVAPGHPSTPGFTDPGHPVEGRVPCVAPAGNAQVSA